MASEMQYKIVKAYLNLVEQINDYDMNFIILIHPKAFLQLEKELKTGMYSKNGVYYVILMGKKVPIIINTEIPDKVNFTIMTQKDYERAEQEHLLKRFKEVFESGGK